MKTGVELIAAERKRQISEEGWTLKHDDAHDEGELSMAASVYAEIASARSARVFAMPLMDAVRECEDRWPWESEWFKPTADPIPNLVKAGALIAAEIDRLQRIRK